MSANDVPRLRAPAHGPRSRARTRGRRATSRRRRQGHRALSAAALGLIPLLHLVQSVDGYVTGEVSLCAEVHRPHRGRGQQHGHATFYTQFKRHPNGEYTVGVCTNTLCAIMGGDHIFDHRLRAPRYRSDETTEDGKVTLERIECNAACDFAPVVMTNWEFFDNQTPETAVQARRRPAIGHGRQADPRSRPGLHLQAGLPGPRRFPDGLADQGPGAGPASLLGLRIAKENGWVAPQVGAGSTSARSSTDGKDDSK